MVITKRLPTAEFKIMKVVWENTPPITTNIIMVKLGNLEEWKVPTVISLMVRLINRGFLRTEKIGKERSYYPIISKEAYLKYETENFIKLYHDDSLVSFVNTFFDDKTLNDDDLIELLNWVKARST